MAIIVFSVYHKVNSPARVVDYITDSHGLPVTERTNRYFVEGQPMLVPTQGHLCPNDPTAALVIMDLARYRYHLIHPPYSGAHNAPVEMIHIIISPAPSDRVSLQELMEMTRDLIQRTPLQGHICLQGGHCNTAIPHVHIAICPYAPDGTHKLHMDKDLLYTLRRTMDHLCTDHGYSIIDSAALRRDPAYNAWYADVQREGKITIHPPRVATAVAHSFQAERALAYVCKRDVQRAEQAEQAEIYAKVSSGYHPQYDSNYYASPWLYHPTHPRMPLRIVGINPDCTPRGELELQAKALEAWAYHCARDVDQSGIPGTEALRQDLLDLARDAGAAAKAAIKMDIRTLDELVMHQIGCRQDITALLYQIRSCKDQLQDPSTTSAQVAVLQDRQARYIDMVAQRQDDVKQLAHIQRTLAPARSRDAWMDYLASMVSPTAAQQVQEVSPDDLEDTIRAIGACVGLPSNRLDTLIRSAQAEGLAIIQQQREMAWLPDYDAIARYRVAQHEASALRALSCDLCSRGIIAWLLGQLVALIADIVMIPATIDLHALVWDCAMEQLFRRHPQPPARKSLGLHPEVVRHCNRQADAVNTHAQQMIREITRTSRILAAADRLPPKRSNRSEHDR